MEVIEKKDEGVIMKEGMFYTLDAIKDHIPFLDDVSYRLLYLRFNDKFLTQEETLKILLHYLSLEIHLIE